jgi:hypothetical protein
MLKYLSGGIGMARHTVRPLPFWAPAKADGIEKRFVQIGDSFLMDERIQRLPPNAFRVYMHMMNASGGTIEFEMPHRAYKGFISKPSFIKAVDDLVRAGFIEVVQSGFNLRKPSRYRFSRAWRERTGGG